MLKNTSFDENLPKVKLNFKATMYYVRLFRSCSGNIILALKKTTFFGVIEIGSSRNT